MDFRFDLHRAGRSLHAWVIVQCDRDHGKVFRDSCEDKGGGMAMRSVLAALCTLVVAVGCSSTDAADAAVIWGGRRVELAIQDTTVIMTRLCIAAKFPGIVPNGQGQYSVDGVITHSTSGTGIGTRHRLTGRVSGDSMFIQGANFINGAWTPPSSADTVVKYREGDFTPDGHGCVT